MHLTLTNTAEGGRHAEVSRGTDIALLAGGVVTAIKAHAGCTVTRVSSTVTLTGHTSTTVVLVGITKHRYSR